MPASWGLQQTTKKLKKTDRPLAGPVLLRQGEPGTSQYIAYLLTPLFLTVFPVFYMVGSSRPGLVQALRMEKYQWMTAYHRPSDIYIREIKGIDVSSIK